MENRDKAKVLVTVLPVVLIILILAVTLIVNALKKDDSGEDLQQSIKEYADENHSEVEGDTMDSSSSVSSGSVVYEKDEEEEPEAESTPAPTPTPYKEVMETVKVDYSKIEFDAKAQLKEMTAYWEDNNQKALDDLAKLDWFIAMSYSLRGTKNHLYYGDTDANGNPSGKGIAVYADNQYYYGDWKNGVRSGTGTWMHYHLHQEAQTTDAILYHHYTGGWANDLPAGEGSEHYDFDLTLLKSDIGYNANLIGSYAAGLVNGEFYITNIYYDGNQKEWYAQAENGSWIYQNESKDAVGRRPVQVEVSNPDNYIWMYPRDNVNVGVPCLISENKN